MLGFRWYFRTRQDTHTHTHTHTHTQHEHTQQDSQTRSHQRGPSGPPPCIPYTYACMCVHTLIHRLTNSKPPERALRTSSLDTTGLPFWSVKPPSHSGVFTSVKRFRTPVQVGNTFYREHILPSHSEVCPRVNRAWKMVKRDLIKK